jgi:hypothetical protein
VYGLAEKWWTGDRGSNDQHGGAILHRREREDWLVDGEVGALKILEIGSNSTGLTGQVCKGSARATRMAQLCAIIE